MSTADPHHVIDNVWKLESTRLIGALTRIVRDVSLAEELAQDAIVAALQQWPESGVPDNPGAWLMTAAKHRAIDLLRRKTLLERKHEELGRELAARQAMDTDDLVARIIESSDEYMEDDALRLVFIACHPVLSTESQVALTLRLLGGLTTEEIARAFLIAEPTVAQRIVRAKRTLGEKDVHFEVPRRDELESRLAPVLQVIYLIFNEGYTATTGNDWIRPKLCEEALRLGRLLTELVPREPEVHALLALMEIQSSRSKARISETGEPILFMDQNRELWDQSRISQGLSALERAQTVADSQALARGPYALQAEIAACHASARSASETNWPHIASLYDSLANVTPTPVVELNRAVAHSMAFGSEAGLKLVDKLRLEPSIKNYHLLPSVRGDLLMKLGRLDEARVEFERAAALTQNERERALLKKRAHQCHVESSPSGG